MLEESLSYAMLSDPGRVRQGNEDACAADLAHGIFVVCDGVGGAAGGEIASQLAAKSFVTRVAAARHAARQAAREAQPDPQPDPQRGAEDCIPESVPESIPESAPESIPESVRDAIDFANHAVHSQSRERVELHGMATTMVAMVFATEQPAEGERAGDATQSAGMVWLANVGDSRCYRLRKGEFEQLSQDHSIVEEQVRWGVITREQADVSPIRNVITRAIGSEPEVIADVVGLSAFHGDIYLLASDGLTREMAVEDVAMALREARVGMELLDASGLKSTCAELVRLANERGGGDNITCLLVQVR